MNTLKKLLATTAVIGALVAPAVAHAGNSMSIDFVGDWCHYEFDAKTKEANYRLPSWTEDGECNKAKNSLYH